jgi:hypothetical protein
MIGLEPAPAGAEGADGPRRGHPSEMAHAEIVDEEAQQLELEQACEFNCELGGAIRRARLQPGHQAASDSIVICHPANALTPCAEM